MTKSKPKPFGPLYQKAVKDQARERGLKGAAMSIYAAIVSYCNGETGQARPGNKAIIEDTGWDAKTLERALKRLRAEEFLLPIAYANGGRGRAVVYAFPLPAWSGQPRQETTDIKSVETKQAENINHRHSVPKPPTFCPETTDIKSDPTERTERTENMGAAGRSGSGRTSAPMGEGAKVPARSLMEFAKSVGIDTGQAYGTVRSELTRRGYEIVR